MGDHEHKTKDMTKKYWIMLKSTRQRYGFFAPPQALKIGHHFGPFQNVDQVVDIGVVEAEPAFESDGFAPDLERVFHIHLHDRFWPRRAAEKAALKGKTRKDQVLAPNIDGQQVPLDDHFLALPSFDRRRKLGVGKLLFVLLIVFIFPANVGQNFPSQVLGLGCRWGRDRQSPHQAQPEKKASSKVHT
jgi:hypothetical protein